MCPERTGLGVIGFVFFYQRERHILSLLEQAQIGVSV